MITNELKHKVNLQKWATAIQECRGSGMTVKAWCQEQGVTSTTYYRWERELLGMAGKSRNKQELATTLAFAELPAPRQQCRTVSEQAATVRIGDMAIDI